MHHKTRQPLIHQTIQLSCPCTTRHNIKLYSFLVHAPQDTAATNTSNYSAFWSMHHKTRQPLIHQTIQLSGPCTTRHGSHKYIKLFSFLVHAPQDTAATNTSNYSAFWSMHHKTRQPLIHQTIQLSGPCTTRHSSH